MASVYQLALFPLEKRCAHCDLLKTIGDFPVQRRTAHGRTYFTFKALCFACTRERDRDAWPRTTRAKEAQGRRKQRADASEKRCSRCGTVKPRSAFRSRPERLSGLTSWCKDCANADARTKEPDAGAMPDMKRCSTCELLKPRSAFDRLRASTDGRRDWCKECRRANSRVHCRANAAQRPPTEAQTLAAEGMRRCSKCRVIQRLEAFYASKAHPSRREADCKRCRRAAVNERAAANDHAYGRAYYAANRDHLRRRMLERWRAHRSERYEANKAWKAAHPDWVRTHSNHAKARRRARLARAGGAHTAKDIAKLYAAQQGLCAYCGTAVGACYHVDHIVALARGGSNDRANLCIACPGCNASKGDKLLSEWDTRPYTREAVLRVDRPERTSGQGD